MSFSCFIFQCLSYSTHLSHIENCTDCPAGQYCQDRGATAPTGPCKQGHICYGNALGFDPVYNDDVSGNKTALLWGDTCHAGNYCPEGTALMVACPRGTYNPDRGGTSELQACKPCDPGMYCNGTRLIAPTGRGNRSSHSFAFLGMSILYDFVHILLPCYLNGIKCFFLSPFL